ncbi:hypothetical protein UCDDA912_g07557 [Diaporthe ampelina]|uniref:Uncharacterized protein n=1 Tax=Diaporthe ampelina TaxID=1214573 RepID=A0A0G2HWY9_9PEZI|nr:hypothetical protein UCDDA912_g07557 [Diaporthe ampelina]
MSNHYGWVGDWGSDKIAIPGTNHFPNCLWIDLDGGAPATAFQVNWVDMTPADNDTRMGKSPKDMCQSPSFHIYQHHDPDSIIYHDRENDRQGPSPSAALKRSEPAPPVKRSKSRRTAAEAQLAFEQKYGNMLVVDDVPSHTAHALCESATSAGPSFVNPEHGYFCDMQTKTIHPVCKMQNGTAVCFEMEQEQLGKLTQSRVSVLVGTMGISRL